MGQIVGGACCGVERGERKGASGSSALDLLCRQRIYHVAIRDVEICQLQSVDGAAIGSPPDAVPDGDNNVSFDKLSSAGKGLHQCQTRTYAAAPGRAGRSCRLLYANIGGWCLHAEARSVDDGDDGSRSYAAGPPKACSLVRGTAGQQSIQRPQTIEFGHRLTRSASARLSTTGRSRRFEWPAPPHHAEMVRGFRRAVIGSCLPLASRTVAAGCCPKRRHGGRGGVWLL